ncbi:hypothetical protein PHYSODRAFT_520231 [Phytophthora sojae]|uniref:Uncharacterized protein n=1 Tax=Phytophthora sojae (strain P6497) TaxID=1094619 RepID=G5A0R6_PHYSP|nr:hypothetical protein PHYSODRAFT_520231 [Phytophthora sojae]EGZ11402.1 hypothetical protein PHYSODRAFT_520231 [Phytophthora sojae]|eukprot:XP_009534147.1 hypothetical protein PHYSODRAFT_520231 [Phytophthora sojae]
MEGDIRSEVVILCCFLSSGKFEPRVVLVGSFSIYPRTRRSSTSTSSRRTTADDGDTDERRAKAQRISLPEVPNCSLFDVLRTAPSSIVRMLTSREACKLLISCSRGVAQDVRDAIASDAFPLYYEASDVHLGKNLRVKCFGDWHQLVPAHIATNHFDCTCPTYDDQYRTLVNSSTWSLPRSPRARTHLLEAVHLVYQGIRRHCFQYMQLPTTTMRRMPSWWGWFVPIGVLQPVAFSLVTAMEVDRQNDGEVLTNDDVESIDTDNVDELARLVNIVEPELGFRFFSTRSDAREAANVVEAHWRGIEVDAVTSATVCRYCENYEKSFLCTRTLNYLKTDMFTAHCADVYQPLKKFMLRYLKHVRYVRSPRGWNEDDEEIYGFKRPFRDLIAGFTPTGVVVGVHLVVPDIPNDRD